MSYLENLLLSSDDDESSIEVPTLPLAFPMFGDEDSDSSDERMAILAARQRRSSHQENGGDVDRDSMKEQQNSETSLKVLKNNNKCGLLTLNMSDSEEDSFDCDYLNVKPPCNFSRKTHPKNKDSEEKEKIDKVPVKVDYSGIFNEEGLICFSDCDSPKKRKSKSNLGIFNLKKKKVFEEIGYKDVKPTEKNKEKGIFELMKDDENQRDIGKAIFQQRKKELEEIETERNDCAIANAKLQNDDDFQVDLSAAISLQKLPMKKVVKKQKSKAEAISQRKSSSSSTTTEKTRKRKNNHPASLSNNIEEKHVATAIHAADILEDAANLHKKKQKQKTKTKPRKIVNMRRKKITDAPPIIKWFGNITRMMVVLRVWKGNEYKPQDVDKEIIDNIIAGANNFLEMARKLGENVLALCLKFFEMNKNTAMKDIIKGLRDNTDEIYQRPTVRRVPSKNAIDPWSGEELTIESIKKKASLILCPRSEEDASACTIILPKNVPAFLSLLHGAFHLENYVENYISQALDDVNGLNPSMCWNDVWEKCAGKNLSKKPIFSWPKGAKSRDSNPFTNVVVSARELIYAILFVESELKKILKEEGESE